MGYILFGVIVALVQWPVVRWEIPGVMAWVLACVIGWSVCHYLSQVALDVLFNSPMVAPVARTLVISGKSGLVAGAITGLALVWIARQPDIALLRLQDEGAEEEGVL